MNDPQTSPTDREHDLAVELRLRPERPQVTRLSRKVITALATIAAVAVAAALMWGLGQGRSKQSSNVELYQIENKPMPEGLSALPRDYSGIERSSRLSVPELGPPLPGDLGRPVLAAQGAHLPIQPAVDPEKQRAAQEREAARTSHLFATTNARERPSQVNSINRAPAEQAPAEPPGAGRNELAAADPEAVQNMQDRKLAFLTAAVDRKTVSPDRLANPVSRYVVQAGSVIPGALITGLRSDLPGPVSAQVTENVYDSPTGRYLLIPQGAKLVGIYDSQVAFGQDRVLLVWTRLLLPNGRSIVLERQPGADPQGFAGLEDDVDYHWGRLFGAALLSTVLGVGSELGSSGNENGIVQALRQASSESLNQTGQQVVRRNLNVQPTLTIRPGFPIRVLVNRDLVLAPYLTTGDLL